WRTRVDLPLPDRPMMQNTSPSPTSKETSATATTDLKRSNTSARPSPSRSMAASASLARSPKTFQTARHSIADEFDMASAVERLGPISNSQIDAHLPRSGGGASDRSADALRRASVGAAHRQFSVAGFSTPSARSPIQNHTSSGLAFMKRSAAAS